MNGRKAFSWLFFVALVTAAHAAWIDDGACGQDAWILVEASRVESAGDLVGLFAQELRDGVRPSTAFFRPLVNLSFAVDDALFRESWEALHLSSLVLHLLASLALAALARRLGLRPAIAWGVGALFALHPLSVEVVPAPARRGESLVLLLSLLSAWFLVGADERPRRWGVAWGLGALAPLAKEVGFLVPLLWWALPTGIPRRRRAWVGLIAVLPALVLRTLVLGGEGGYGGGWEFSTAGIVDGLVDLADPFRIYGGWGARFVVLVIVAASVGLAWRRRGPSGAAARVGLVWWLAPLLLVTLARGIAAWYLYVPLAGWCLMVAALLESVHLRRRAATLGATVVAGAVIAVPSGLGSPLFREYPEWAIAGRSSAAVLEAADAHLDAWAGGRITVIGLPREVHLLPPPRYHVRSATSLSADSLRRYVELRTDRLTEVVSLADVVITGTGSPGLRCDLLDEGEVVVRTEGPARLLSPMWPASGAGEISTGALAARVAIPDGPVWVWNGRDWSLLVAAPEATTGR